MTMSKCLGLLSLVGVLTTPAMAQSISAERPGFSSSPLTLAARTLQLEGGYEYRDGGRSEAHTLPLGLLRYGLLERLELQLSWAGYSRIDVPGADVEGVTDAGLGFKWQATGADAPVPIGIFAGLSLPVGDSELSSDEVDPVLGLFWTRSTAVDLFGTVLISESDNDTVLTNAVGAAFSFDDRRGGYLEYFGSFSDGGGPEHVLNGGLTWLMAVDLQLDVNAGVGLNGRAPDYFVGAGVAYRF